MEQWMRNGEWDKDSEMVGEPRSKQRATNNNTSYEESYSTIPLKEKKKQNPQWHYLSKTSV